MTAWSQCAVDLCLFSVALYCASFCFFSLLWVYYYFFLAFLCLWVRLSCWSIWPSVPLRAGRLLTPGLCSSAHLLHVLSLPQWLYCPPVFWVIFLFFLVLWLCWMYFLINACHYQTQQTLNFYFLCVLNILLQIQDIKARNLVCKLSLLWQMEFFLPNLPI